MSGAKTWDEYLFLVRSLEDRLGLTAPTDTPKALSVVRQIYYGSASWTKESGRIGLFDRFITSRPWSPSVDPTPLLTQPPMQALQKTEVVEGTEVGHLFAGMDAMMNPQVVAPSSLINEEAVSWSGDVGSAAAGWAVDMFYGRKLRKDGGGPPGRADEYFAGLASAGDLLGDIDAFAMRAGLSPSSASQSLLMQKIQLRGPLSEALLQYYRITRSDLGKARNRRCAIFLESYGGIVNGSSLTNPPAVIATLRPKVENFSALFAIPLLAKHQGRLWRSDRTPRRPTFVRRAFVGRECEDDRSVREFSSG